MGNLAAPVAEWTVGGTALTSLMDVERRHGMPFIFHLIILVNADSLEKLFYPKSRIAYVQIAPTFTLGVLTSDSLFQQSGKFINCEGLFLTISYCMF